MVYLIAEDSEDNLKGLAIVVDNGVFVNISEGDHRFGTTAIALPVKTDEGFGVSSVIPAYGVKNEILAKSIAEKIAQRTTKISIASILLKRESPENMDSALNLLKKLMEKLKI